MYYLNHFKGQLMRLTLQTYFDGERHHAATLELKDDAAGFQGASIVDYDLGGRDHLPDWKHICGELKPDPAEQSALEAELSTFAEHLRQAPTMAKDMSTPPDILDRAMGRCIAIADSVLAACQ
ncbi:type II toxin-antitoxin system HipA family toxin [Pseudorhizobium endolithicum]|uniref:Type II toxin-antitoxin system HipA family toxin n=1 Tax=Pseudorhizobium endolithicum TaxID=1191678 RepID=A0ABN7JMZ3_9HYPH|nr:hypothetical protein [Pseudorhizobium endolithicum]CAD7037614.1 type II toxin-antitoxin system HipA family toxin [Pseudorhizobium endolithicum]